MNKLVVLIYLLVLLSCVGNSKQDLQFSHISKLDFFQTIPSNFGLQGDYYTYDTTEIANEKYIFISDLTDSAIICINGNVIHLSKNTQNDLHRVNDQFQEGWKAKDLDVVLKLKILKEEDEEIYCNGIIELYYKNRKVVFKIHGHSIT